MCESRTPPAAVARQLRQEAGFGCVFCGCPIIEYHHIIPWEEQHHFEAEHMVVVCPTHHREYGKLPRKRAYTGKANPINIRTGRLSGFLGGNKEQRSLRFGPYSFKNAVAKINFANIELVSYRLEDEQYLLNCFIPDKRFWPLVRVMDNVMSADIADFWDIEFKTNWVRFRNTSRARFLEIDFRGDEIEVSCDIVLAGDRVAFSRKESTYGGVKRIEMGYGGAPGGEMGSALSFGFGPDVRIFPANFAMAKPRALLVPE